jgi:CHAD domain-containing protein
LAKVVRVLGDRVEAPEVPEPWKVRRKDRIGALVVAALSEHVRSLRTHDPRVRLGLDDAVHQMRVSTRKLRSVLNTFGPVLDEEWTTGLRSELKWLGRTLGAARDAEVLAAGLERALEGLAPSEAAAARQLVAAEMARREASSTKTVLKALRSARYLALVDSLVVAVREPALLGAADETCRDTVPAIIEASWQRLDRKAKKASRSKATDHQLHRARIAAKQARYATETAATAFGVTAARLAAQAERVQDVLGEQHDAVVAAAEVASLARKAASPPAAFALGILHEQLLEAGRTHRQEFAEVWAEAQRSKYRKWLNA